MYIQPYWSYHSMQVAATLSLRFPSCNEYWNDSDTKPLPDEVLAYTNGLATVRAIAAFSA
jgi:hypothetical protein